jgi:hypothetical protein
MMARAYPPAMEEYATTGMVFYHFGLFCAYWAQQTKRSPWLWFFVGCFFAPITGIILVVKNARDLNTPRSREEMFSQVDDSP